MKGTILDFSIQTNTGVISGDDARRLHDTNRSGWWYLMSLTIIGIIPLIIWWAQSGDSHNNQYGEPTL